MLGTMRIERTEVPMTAARSIVRRLSDHRYILGGLLRPLAVHYLRQQRQCMILCLHNPRPDILHQLLSALRPIGPFVRYSDIVACLQEDHSPPRGFAITFDDGYRENVDLLDVLDEHRCPALFFISSGCLDSLRPLWFMTSKSRNVMLRALKAGKTRSRKDFLEFLQQEGLSEPQTSHGRFGLTSEDLTTIVSRGHEIGTHTHNHPFLGGWSPQDIRAEILEGSERVSKLLGGLVEPLHFAYPSGDYSDTAIEVIKELGIRSAVTSDRGAVTRHSSIWALPRCVVADADYSGWALWKMTSFHRRLCGLLRSHSSAFRA